MIYIPLREEFDNESELECVRLWNEEIRKRDDIGYFDKCEFTLHAMDYIVTVLKSDRGEE